jgi:hypothetical protein
VKVPAPLLNLLDELTSHEVSYGFTGLKLLEAEEAFAGQIGYSVSPDGQSFCGTKPGDWRANWFVVGHDTELGDPIFIDLAAAGSPVFTAAHGDGAWDPKLVAISLQAFARCWREFAVIARGRANPAELEINPLPGAERRAYLDRIKEINEGIEAELWAALLED